MTETIIKKLYVYEKDTHKHAYTMVFEKIMLDKPYYIRCNEKGELVDLRKTQSYVNFDPSTDKLKQVKGYYAISLKYTEHSCKRFYCTEHHDYYVKTSTTIPWEQSTLSRIIQETVSSNIVFISSFAEEEFYERQALIKNEKSESSNNFKLYGSYTFITEDLLGEDIPTPDRAFKQIKAREDRERKKQSRNTLFETFILPGLDIEGFHYCNYSKNFYMDASDAVEILKKHIKEVIILKSKEIGVQINIKDFNLGALQWRCSIPLAKVKLDNIDDVE